MEEDDESVWSGLEDVSMVFEREFIEKTLGRIRLDLTDRPAEDLFRVALLSRSDRRPFNGNITQQIEFVSILES